MSIDDCGDPLLDRTAVRVPIVIAYIGVFLICLIGTQLIVSSSPQIIPPLQQAIFSQLW